jgi:hypothetical protein
MYTHTCTYYDSYVCTYIYICDMHKIHIYIYIYKGCYIQLCRGFDITPGPILFVWA